MNSDRDTIIFMGLNKTAVSEVKSLRDAGNKVIFISNSDIQDSVKVGQKRFNLINHNDVVDYVKQLGVIPSQESLLIAAIESGSTSSRDELALLAKVLSEFDKKGTGPSRFILSSHSAGWVFWGDNNGSFDIKNIKKIAEVFPTASSLIEDLHLAGCNSGLENNITKWRDVFPKVQTIWGYVEEAPGAGSGSKTHLARWDKATRGLKSEIDRAIVAKTRMGDHVAIWSKQSGYQFHKSSTIPDLLVRIRQAEPTYQMYFSGTLSVTDPHHGQLRDYYNDLIALLGHPLVTEEQRRNYTPRKDTTLLLLYFDTKVKIKFNRVHSVLIANGYKAVGGKAPDFSSLGRKDCLKAVEELEKIMTSKNVTSIDAQKLKNELVHGLKNLEVSHIPLNWI